MSEHQQQQTALPPIPVDEATGEPKYSKSQWKKMCKQAAKDASKAAKVSFDSISSPPVFSKFIDREFD